VAKTSVRVAFEEALATMENKKRAYEVVQAEIRAEVEGEYSHHDFGDKPRRWWSAKPRRPSLPTSMDLIVFSREANDPRLRRLAGSYTFARERVNTLGQILLIAQNERIIARLDSMIIRLDAIDNNDSKAV
jgi:hypothetical protein